MRPKLKPPLSFFQLSPWFALGVPLPVHNISVKVEPRTSLPLYYINLFMIINLCLALINIGSIITFNILTSLIIAFFYLSFILTAIVFLYRKLITAVINMIYNPFQLGRAGILIILLFLVYSVVNIFFSF